jgi:hypothetical protein
MKAGSCAGGGEAAVAVTGQVRVPHPWHYLGEPTVMFMQALQKTMVPLQVTA